MHKILSLIIILLFASCTKGYEPDSYSPNSNNTVTKPSGFSYGTPSKNEPKKVTKEEIYEINVNNEGVIELKVAELNYRIIYIDYKSNDPEFSKKVHEIANNNNPMFIGLETEKQRNEVALNLFKELQKDGEFKVRTEMLKNKNVEKPRKPAPLIMEGDIPKEEEVKNEKPFLYATPKSGESVYEMAKRLGVKKSDFSSWNNNITELKLGKKYRYKK